MELVDMRDLGSRVERRWGSSPHARTKSLRTTYRSQRLFYKKSLLTHSVAAPFQIEPAALDCDLVLAEH